MTSAREIMHAGAECIGAEQSLADAARRMRDLHVGAMPICGEDDRLQGIITDRDIVVRCIAEGRDPKLTMASELAQGPPIWVEAEADVQQVLAVMEQNAVRRVPVLAEHRLVGMISEADLATHLRDRDVGQFTSAVYSAPPNS
ncbi:CBS domain-containing protein [Phytohabitans suffuscus]|uniref:Hypoxic response protein 1 n=1 Tax=Phytohabitans suffuscus TaxID=624315 RepID=A0A6F8YW18_9ACTN|nr:CBS domain-containing protein [Phytohabitans suffuscus]BCB90051.1 hypoxic response protein 1 [Phytohabitans suffuscus]